ncbi:Hydroxyproline-rich glycoprotein family protein [Quillaja saponaria]|uniref:Hydroxyproline-rich glycoprotein family protein n=1 Tax=Quillaja saponaria TaxID=32244 RepID=A0AAD7Q8Z1_QUISA|nr:Hydroxyproline-rich glycoprotein family protein [Quillaja saponaria]
MNDFSKFFKDNNREEEHDEWLTLKLSVGSNNSHDPNLPSPSVPIQLEAPHHQEPYFSMPSPPPPPPPVPQNPIICHQNSDSAGPSRLVRARRSPAQALKQGKTETVPQLYPWATTRRAMVYNLDYLLSNGIDKISGEVQCKRCEKQYEIEYDLQQKFMEVALFISNNKHTMHDRAPSVWMNPVLPSCKFCGEENCVKPIISKKRTINWLFLLLGQLLGCCKLSALKYFCKHTKNHRTGAKDRVLYLSYLGLCKQLDPKGPFDV